MEHLLGSGGRGGAATTESTTARMGVSRRNTENQARVNLQLGAELAGRSTLLGGGSTSTVETSAVTTLATLTVTTVTAGATVVTTGHATGRSVGAGSLNVGRGDNLGGEVEPLAEEGKTLLSQSVVVVLPRELGLDEALGGERLASLDDL